MAGERLSVYQEKKRQELEAAVYKQQTAEPLGKSALTGAHLPAKVKVKVAAGANVAQLQASHDESIARLAREANNADGGGGGRIRVPPYLHRSGFSSEDNSSGEYTPRDHNGSLERSDSSISFGEPSLMGRVSSEDSSQNRSPSPHTVPLTRHERRENAAVAKEVTLRVGAGRGGWRWACVSGVSRGM